MPAALIDSDTLSEVMRGRDEHIAQQARHYLSQHGRFTFSIVTRYEILRGLMAKRARRQIASFEARCQTSNVLPLTDAIVVTAADIYADLYRSGRLIGDADILIAATAIVHDLTLVTNNLGHFRRITTLRMDSWRTAAG